jgi:O-6-methylguanine DNA methyltransferase
MGRPELARAVGQAVGSNPIPIVVPCHRVVGAHGRLVGFGGGLDAKVALLRLEGVEVDGDTPTSRVHPEVLRLQL